MRLSTSCTPKKSSLPPRTVVSHPSSSFPSAPFSTNRHGIIPHPLRRPRSGFMDDFPCLRHVPQGRIQRIKEVNIVVHELVAGLGTVVSEKLQVSVETGIDEFGDGGQFILPAREFLLRASSYWGGIIFGYKWPWERRFSFGFSVFKRLTGQSKKNKVCGSSISISRRSISTCRSGYFNRGNRLPTLGRGIIIGGNGFPSIRNDYFSRGNGISSLRY